MTTAAAKDTYRPSQRTPYSVRLAMDTVDAAKKAVRAGQAVDVNTWMTQVMEAALGYVRCHRGNCPGRTPPVPVTFGDLRGKTFGEWAAEAVEQVEAQHPRHEPVTIGAEPAVPAPALFLPPAPAVVRDQGGKKGRAGR